MSISKLFLSKDDDGFLLTRNEFAEADFAEHWRYERIRGVLSLMPPTGEEHTDTWEPIRDHLVIYKTKHPDHVHRVVTEAWIAVDDQSDRIADLAVYLKSGHGSIPQRIPELIVEVVSQGPEDRKRDYEDKRADYQRIGVREYVIVDRFEQRVTVLQLIEGEYAEAVLGPDDKYTSSLLPGLEIPLQGII